MTILENRMIFLAEWLHDKMQKTKISETSPKLTSYFRKSEEEYRLLIIMWTILKTNTAESIEYC